MTKRKTSSLASHERSFDIAINMLLRCERFIRDLAFFRGEKTSILARELYENMFHIDGQILKYKVDGELNDYEYRLLSQVNEELTDYAFLASANMHPYDVERLVESEKGGVKFSRSVEFPPANWVNRVARKTQNPLAVYPLGKVKEE
ncbi:hypothetical protein BGW36DRAFT_426833 [Talaromyces proteolyticus]|uniref:Uncharacterized protein n=1 Tax=Talaromyces proteolyticus TaxID=1131652 RepID=A0AAD4PZL7_9EURO|nr:uncharacterized protein BGW36DRAFT_426833 [Talaromyces proteolyticus]KAH8699161.1 hypothetical protein BGW36DRAFT_426833 [Talaromyces proteolyticus]